MTELYPEIHRYALLAATATLLTKNLSSLGCLTRYSSVLAFLLAWVHIAGTVVSDLLAFWPVPEPVPPEVSHLAIHAIVLTLFLVAAVLYYWRVSGRARVFGAGLGNDVLAAQSAASALRSSSGRW